jgi:hypothetical protein
VHQLPFDLAPHHFRSVLLALTATRGAQKFAAGRGDVPLSENVGPKALAALGEIGPMP